MNGKKGFFKAMIGLALLALSLSCTRTAPTPTPTAIPPAATLATAPTNTPVPAPTDTPVPAPTDTPAPAPTNTPVPAPTNTPVPAPTDTPAPAPTNTPVPAPAPDPLLIDNCEDGDNKNLLGGYWFTYDDSDNGGTSEVVPPAGGEFYCTAGGALGTGFSAQMRGRVTADCSCGTDCWYGFVGMGTNFAEPQAPQDISGYRGVSFWVQGDGREYRISFPQASISDFGYYGKTFVAPQGWTQITVLFSELSQEGWATPVPWSGTDIKCVQWQTVGQPHESIFLAIDELRFVQ